MIELRQYVPEERVGDQEFERAIRSYICDELSRQASPTDDDTEFWAEASANVTERRSREDGKWIHSYLDRDARANYLRTDFVAPYKVDVPFAKVSEPVTLDTPEAYGLWMARKAVLRNG